MIVLLLVAGPLHAGALDEVPLYRLEHGEPVPFHLKADTTHVAFYYSASWCPPCRKTTPPLVEEYQRMLNQKGMPVEIVLVGSDESEEKMIAYMKKYQMHWPAVVFRSTGLVEKYAANGIPHMVLVERQTGEVVSHGTGPSGVEAVVARMRDFSMVDTGKPFQAGSWLSKYGVLIAVAVCFVVIFFYQKWREKRIFMA
ncbi:MAG: redoxin family protein [Akkermansiaceae bacterium]|nr:redoxin family protein [Akkermansiaceae bacterium]